MLRRRPPAPDVDLGRRVDAIRWFHTIDLGGGVVTPGQDETLAKVGKLRLPPRLDGRSVLDVGAWDGALAFEAERRGAARVVAVDPACWNPPTWGPDGWGTRAGFDLAREALGSRVEALDLPHLDFVTPEIVGTYDVVLLLGVLYHLPDPWPVLDRVAACARERLVIETHADLLHLRRPAVAYYPDTSVDGDPSNVWGPNAAMLAERLRAGGFTRVHAYYDRLPVRLARSALRRLRPPRYGVAQGRLVVHALR